MGVGRGLGVTLREAEPPPPPRSEHSRPLPQHRAGGGAGSRPSAGPGMRPTSPPPTPPPSHGGVGWGMGGPAAPQRLWDPPTWGLHRTGAPRGSRRAEGGGSGGLGGSRWYTGSQCRARSHCCVGVPVAHGGPSGTWVAWWHVGVPMSCEGPIEIGWHGGVPMACGGPNGTWGSQLHVGVPGPHGGPNEILWHGGVPVTRGLHPNVTLVSQWHMVSQWHVGVPMKDDGAGVSQ